MVAVAVVGVDIVVPDTAPENTPVTVALFESKTHSHVLQFLLKKWDPSAFLASMVMFRSTCWDPRALRCGMR